MVRRNRYNRKLSTPKYKFSGIVYREVEHRPTIWEMIYTTYIFAMMITLNLYFFVFVHYQYDLSPNFALLIVTVPVMIVEGIKIKKIMFRVREEYEEKKEKGELYF